MPITNSDFCNLLKDTLDKIEDPIGKMETNLSDAYKNYFKNELKRKFEDDIIDSDKYKIVANLGNGSAAHCPWIGILDKNVTDSGTKGIYIAYLFKGDGSGVYLSLTQGNGSNKDKIKITKGMTEYIRTLDKSKTNNFSTDINLSLSPSGLKTASSKKYENSHIKGKYYDVSSLSNPGTKPYDDLINMLDVYSKVVKELNMKKENLDDIYQEIAQIGESIEIQELVDNITPDENMDKDDVEEARRALVKVRINQGLFRKSLLEKYNNTCCITNCNVNNKELLRASHIKEWFESDKKERIDVNNGLLLCCNHDAAFDRHLISFKDDGSLIVSKKLDAPNQKELKFIKKIRNKYKKLNTKIIVSSEMKPYLEIHRNKLKEKESK